MGKRNSGGAEISLFPFLSVLAALIGALVVIIVGMAIIQLQKAGGKEPEEITRTQENKKIMAESEELRKQNDDLRQLMETISKSSEALRVKMTQRNALRNIRDNLEKSEKTLIEEKAKLDQLRKENEQLIASEATLRKEIEELQKKLAELKKQPDQTPAVQLRPGGTSTNEVPYFVEVSGAMIAILRKDQPAVEIPVARIDSSPEFRQFLEFLDNNPTSKLVFLIRNNGPSISSYHKANGIVSAYPFRRTNFRPVKMPLPGAGKLDLSIFYGK